MLYFFLRGQRSIDMSGGPKGAKRPLARPLDGGLCHIATLLEVLIDRGNQFGHVVVVMA